MASTKTIVMYAVPIPVGHRVVIRWYRSETKGLFGKKAKERAYQPVITDLDTGIEYTSDFTHDGGDGMKRPDTPIAIADAVGATFVVEREVTGRVTACRVVHVRGYSELDVQTHLSIDE